MNRTCPETKWLARLFATVFVLSAAVFPYVAGAARAEEKAYAQLGPGEKFVLGRLAAGKIADLNGRALNTAFVEKLLAGEYKNLPHGVRIQRARFAKRIDISGEGVAYETWLNHCVFDDGVDFSGTHFSKGVSLEGSQFHVDASKKREPGDEPGIFFNGMKVTGAANFRKAVFDGPVDFTGAEISGDFVADGATFKAPDPAADFDSLRVNGGAFFRNANLNGRLKLWKANVLDLFLEGFQQDAAELDLSEAVIQRELSIRGLNVQDFTAPWLSVPGHATLRDIGIERVIDLGQASFKHLSLDLRKKRGPGRHLLRLDGMRYDGLDSPEQEKNLIEEAPFLADQYLQLEAFLRTHGYSDSADKVQLNMKRHERHELPKWSLSWWANLLQDLAFCYGTCPQRPFYWCGFVVFLGYLVFNRKERMDPQNPENASKYYSPFWYSLDLFAPVIDLQVATVWAPKQDWTFGRQYARLQRVLGWILIPVALAGMNWGFR